MQKSYNLFNTRLKTKEDTSPQLGSRNDDLSVGQQSTMNLDYTENKSKKFRPEDVMRQQSQSMNKNTLNSRILNEDLPGSKDIALKHCLAVKVGKPSNGSPEVCPCCMRKIDEPLSWNFNPEDIGFLGVGYPQFYYFLKYCIFIVFAIIISSSSFNVLSNAMLGNDCYPDDMIDEYDIKSGVVCQYSWTTFFSLANKRNLPQIMAMQQVLNLFTIFTIIVLLFKARIKFFQLTDDITTLFCPSAYTIFIENIPNRVIGLQGRSIERLIANTIKTAFGVEPIAVNVCWNLRDLSKLNAEKDAIIRKIQQEIEALPDDQLYLVKSLRQQIQQEKEEKFNQGFIIKKRLSLNLSDDDLIKYFTGKVFVVFSRIEDKESVLSQYKELNQEDTPLFVGDYYDNRQNPPTLLQKNDKKKRKGVKITPAVPPNEIIWENAQYSNQFVRKRKILFWGASVLCMLACYATIGALLQCQRKFSSSKLGLVTNGYWVQSFAILVSLLIYVLNTVLRYLLAYFNQKTYFTLKTEASMNMAGKLAIAYFLNSGIMAFIIDVIIPRFSGDNGIQASRVAIYRTGGLIYNMQYIFVMNAIIIPCMQLVDTSKLFQMYYQWKADKKQQDLSRSTYTQQQLNNIYMNPVSDLVYDYALIISQMYFMAFYSPLIPIGTGTTLITLLAFYFIHRFKLARHRSVLNNVGSELCIEMTEMLEMILPIYCFSNLIFEYILSENNIFSTYAICGFLIGVLNAVLPMDKLKNLFLNRDSNDFPFSKPSYYELKDKFETEYDIENPVTRDTYLRYIQETNTIYNGSGSHREEKETKTFKSFTNILNRI